MMKLKFEDIKVKERLLIRSSTIDITSNGLYLIEGKNGSGKTSLVKQLTSTYHDFITTMFQENNAIDTSRSVFDNISMDQFDKEYITKKLERYNFDYLLEKDSHKLSGGEKRLVALIRALFSNRSIIILDEPLNDLDYLVIRSVRELIIDVSKEKVILIISHIKIDFHYVQTYLIINKHLLLKYKEKRNNTVIERSNPYKEYKFKKMIIPIVSVLLLVLFTSYSIKRLNIYESIIIEDQNYYLTNIRSTNITERIINAAVDVSRLTCMKNILGSCVEKNNGITYKKYDYNKLGLEYYPLEFYNEKEKTFYLISSYISETFFEGNSLSTNEEYNVSKDIKQTIKVPIAYPITNKLIATFKKFDMTLEHDESVDEIIVPLNKKLYKSFYDAHKNNDVLDALIITDGKELNLINTLSNEDNLYLKGKVITDLLNEAGKIYQIKSVAKEIGFMILLFFVFNTAFIFVCERSSKTIIKTLYNYGFNDKDINNGRRKLYLLDYQKYLYIVSLIIAIVLSITIGVIVGIIFYMIMIVVIWLYAYWIGMIIKFNIGGLKKCIKL